MPDYIAASAYDALYTSIAEATDSTIEEVGKALTHREFPGDSFRDAWDNAVREGADFYRYIAKETAGQ